jgi:alpha-L-fucosidase 2
LKNKITILSLTLLLCYGCKESATKHQKVLKQRYVLWYEQPATHFEESLVLGNGKMGASVFGGVEVDSIYLNDATLWAGEPVDSSMNPNGHLYIPKVRTALENENYKEADRLIRNVQGPFSQSYAPLGTMYFEFDHNDQKVENYCRSLNISDAISKVTYQIGDTTFSRKYLVSHPDQIMLVRLESDKPNALNFSIDFSSLLPVQTYQENDIQKTDGYAPYHAAPSYRKNEKDPVRFDENRAIHFSNYIKI